VQDRLQRTHKAVGWPCDPATPPPSYDGPEEIPPQDQHRIVRRDCYVTCYPDYLDDMQEDNNARVKRGQETFLRQASLSQLVRSPEQAAQALRAMAKGDFDTPRTHATLYSEAFWHLACLRRAGELSPRETWPDNALEQRNLLADAAGRLLVCVGGTPEA